MLQLKSVHFSYAKRFQLQDISLELKVGKILGIIGESGCGKTTLLKLIFGKLDPEKGELYWDDDKILGPSHQLIAGKEDFKYVTQDSELMPYISVLDNIIKPLSRQHLQENIKRARELLKVVNLEHLENTEVKNLSGGQQQRVALAKALAKTPKLLLLDEPFSHIDRFFKNELRRKLFKFIKDENITCVLATHDKDDILPYADKMLVLKEGKIMDINTPKALYKMPNHPYIAGLFGDYNVINTQEIWSSEKQSKTLIVYPDEILLEESNQAGVEVIDQYFMGHFYKIVLRWKEKTIFAHIDNALDTNQTYQLTFNANKIKTRLAKS